MLLNIQGENHHKGGQMVRNVEISSFDLRYESYRVRDKAAERLLLCSISENGIRDPLEGVDTENGCILLNGFKRYRCAKKLGIGIVPYFCLGDDEVMGIIKLLRISNSKTLSILEQAKLIDDLRCVHKMSILEIADSLGRSKSWVSMRLGIIARMSDCVRQRIFKGEFPVYSYMYTLRQFIRMNCAQKHEIDEFVDLVSGRNLSIRDIERLAYGYFRGPDDFRLHIKKGNILWALEQMKDIVRDINECNESERSMLRDLEIIHKYMRQVIYKNWDVRFRHHSFYAQANLLAGGILSKINLFRRALEEFYDRSGQA